MNRARESAPPIAADAADTALQPQLQQRYAGVQFFMAMSAASLLLVGFIWSIFMPAARDVAQILAGIASLIVAVPVAASVWNSLREPGLHGVTDRLIGLTMLAAWVSGDMVTAALLPTIMIFGHVLEERSLESSQNAIRGLQKLGRGIAHRRTAEGVFEDVDNQALAVGDEVEVRAGEHIPSDGIVLDGYANIDNAILTGESAWTAVGEGRHVLGGAINMDGLLRLRITKIGEDAALGQIIKLMHTAEHAKPQITRLIERHAGVYTLMIVLIAAMVWFASGNVPAMLAVLVAACPCALVIAAPAPALAAVAVAARHGILIRGAAFLEEMGDLTSLIIDKTGTLTQGRLELVAVDTVQPQDRVMAMSLAAGLGNHSNHPVSRALVRQAHSGNAATLYDITEHQGLGLTGRTQDDDIIALGQSALFAQLGIDIPALPDHDGPLAGIAINGRFLTWFRFADPCRAEARAALHDIGQLGLGRQILLTGDHAKAAQRVADEVGIRQVHAQVLPQDKLHAVIEETQSGQRPLVVGDGINDALALRAGAVGIAMGDKGTDVAIAAADIILISSDLRRIGTCIRLSRQCRQTIQVNGLMALGWTVVLMSLAALGWLGGNGAIGAALLHNIGTLLVLGNSARLLRFYEPLDQAAGVSLGEPVAVVL
ncbi:MAG: metal-transporting ATPase [Herbaspirillum sp.]|nr:metal-transporting ATPase [Herbaspirillum sp.]